jgi:hypothetical protein
LLATGYTGPQLGCHQGWSTTTRRRLKGQTPQSKQPGLQSSSQTPIAFLMRPHTSLTPRERLDLIEDSVVPFSTLLAGPAEEVLNAALAAVGGRATGVRATQVRYAPEKSITVQYTATVAWGDRITKETLVASSGITVPKETVELDVDGARITLWRYPRDPFLPGLEAATDPRRMNLLLADLGSPQVSTNLRRRAYRPGRRAVIEAVAPTTRIFIKVVRPDRVEAIHNKHSAMAGRVPVPHSYGWSADLGLVALQAMSGRTLRQVLESGSRRLPQPARIRTLLQALPQPPEPTPVRGPAAQASRHGRVLGVVAPELRQEIHEVVEAVGSVEDEETVPVHGDFHSAQVLVRGEEVVGLVDVDTAGVGQRADDFAGILGHLSTLTLTSPKRKVMDSYGSSLIREFDLRTDPATLRLRVAAVVLGLATGPFRVQESAWPAATRRRIDLALRWVRSAEAIG